MCAKLLKSTHFFLSPLRVKARNESVAGGAAGGNECEVWQALEVLLPLKFCTTKRVPIYVTFIVFIVDHSVVESVDDFHFVADRIFHLGSLLLDMVDTYMKNTAVAYTDMLSRNFSVAAGRAHLNFGTRRTMEVGKLMVASVTWVAETKCLINRVRIQS